MGLFDKIFGRKRSATAEIPKSKLDEVSKLLPFPILAVRGDQAEAELMKLREEMEGTQQTPVIIGEYEDVWRLTDIWDEPFDFEEELQAATNTDVEEWFKQRIDEESKMGGPHSDFYGSLDKSDLDWCMNRDSCVLWKEKISHEVFIAIIPTSDISTIPLYLRFRPDGFTEPFVHTMLARYWFKRFGAEIIAIEGRAIAYSVERLPSSGEEVLELARQRYLYCGGVMEEYGETIPGIARHLRHAKHWYIWWD